MTSAPEVADIRPKRVLFFSTLPEKIDSNRRIGLHIIEAYSRVFHQDQVFRASISQCADAIAQVRPHLIIGLGSVALDAVNWSYIFHCSRRFEAKLIYWVFDDPYEIDFNWKVKNNCDWIFTSDLASVEYYDVPRCSHLPLAADMRSHVRKQSGCGRAGPDLFFCGYAYENRKSLIRDLSCELTKHKSVIRGEGWPSELSFCLNIRLNAIELHENYASACAVLYLGRDLNIANSANEVVGSTPGPRLFEAAAAGACQLCFFESTELFDYYSPDEEILTFSSVSEFRVKLERLLDDPSVSQKIGESSRRRTIKDHLYDNRVAHLRIINNAEKQ